MGLYGINPSKAVENILKRKEERLKNIKNSKNKIKSALIVQGGSMRGAFSAGSLIALEKMGFTQGFDAVYASSGGAVNASYFLSKQAPFGASIYYEDINNSKFINILRIKKIIGINYLFDVVMIKTKPLNAKKVINSKTQFYFFVTDTKTGKYEKVKPKSKNFLELLKASCSMPFYCNQVVCVQGRDYIDGGVSMAIPIEEAIKGSCTDILVLLTCPVKSRDSMGSVENFFLKLAMPKLSKFVDIYLKAYNSSFDLSIGRIKTKKKVNIAAIVPDDNFSLNRLTKNENLLKGAAINGASKVFELFNKECDTSNILSYN